MRILHTSDWHLGKTLEGYSRLSEQKMFIEELIKICDYENIDLIIIAGDVYDTINPPIDAEKLFYSAVKRLSLNGERPIIVIAGNHDSANRIVASKPLADEFGIILTGTIKNSTPIGNYGKFKINNSCEGVFEIEHKNENIVFVTLPYPSEKNLNEILSQSLEEKEIQISYSNKIAEILKEKSKSFKDDTINIVVGHFFLVGGEETDSEEHIQLGGSYAVNANVFPQDVKYVAMGHLHRAQQIKNCSVKNVYYSGSPIQYSKSEVNHKKSVYIIDIDFNEIKEIKTIPLTNYKPIEVWKFNNYEDALIKCIEYSNKNCWVYIDIKSSTPLLSNEIRALHENKKDIVSINVSLDNELDEKGNNKELFVEQSIGEDFCDFYKELKGVKPSNEIYELLMKFTVGNFGGDDDASFDA